MSRSKKDPSPAAGKGEPTGPAPGGPRGWVERVASWSMRRRWTVLGVWFLLVFASYGASLGTGVNEQEDADTLSGQAAVAERLLDNAEFDDEGATESVFVQARSGTLDPEASAALVADMSRRYRALPNVLEVRPPVTSADGRSVLFQVEIDRGRGEERKPSKAVIGPMLEVTQDAAAAHPELRIDSVGAGTITKALAEGAAADFRRAEIISIPLTFVILMLVFGALVAAGVPIILGLTSVFFALGLAGVTSFALPANSNQASLILLLGLAVAVDYSLFYMRRAREERSAGLDPDAALRVAAATSGRAVVVSGIAVMVAMAGMFLSGNAIFSSLALGAIIVVGIAVLGSVTALPAVLSLLGGKVEKIRLPFAGRRARTEGSRFWSAVLKPVLRAPAAAVVLGLLAMGLMAWPVTDMAFKMPSDADLPRGYEVVKTLKRVNEAFPGNKASHIVVVEAPAARNAEVRSALDRLYRQAEGTGDFALTGTPVIVSSNDQRVTKMSLAIPHEPSTQAARDTLTEVREDLAPGTLGQVAGADWSVGGSVAFDADFSKVQQERLPWVVGFVVLFCLIVMVAAFRSLWIALITGLLNLVSVGAAYGVMVLVFQHRWAEDLLGFESTGAIVSWIPLILFVVLFGLSMDYHVFVLSRIRDALRAGAAPREAIRDGVVRSAGVVTSAAAIMVAVFAVFATLSTIEMKQLGVGLAIAILLDATVVRGVLLPGALALMDRRAWPRDVLEAGASPERAEADRDVRRDAGAGAADADAGVGAGSVADDTADIESSTPTR
ncbi:MMPL family transporter [Actinomadura welshii]